MRVPVSRPSGFRTQRARRLLGPLTAAVCAAGFLGGCGPLAGAVGPTGAAHGLGHRSDSSTMPPVGPPTGHRSRLPIPPHFYGVNYDYQGAATFARAPRPALLRALAPATLRWPGGTEADYFDWQTGRDPMARRSFAFTLQDLLAAYRATGAIPIFDLNVMAAGSRRNPANQLQMLRQAAALGLPVRYVEIGNELYSGRARAAFPTGAAYAETVRIYAKALHAAFPGVQVAADACFALTPGCPPGWNRQLLANATGTGSPDALILHAYPGHVFHPFTASDVPSLFAGVYTALATVRQGVHNLGGKPVWLTEYNFRGPYHKGQSPLANPVQTRYARELYVAAFALMLPRIPHLALADEWAAFAGGAAYSDWTPGSPQRLTPVGQAVALVDAAAQGARFTMPVVFPHSPTLPGGYPAVVGQIFYPAAGSARAVLVNLSGTAITLPPRAPWTVGRSYEQVAGNPLARVTVALAPTVGQVSRSGLVLPAYSLTSIGPGSGG